MLDGLLVFHSNTMIYSVSGFGVVKRSLNRSWVLFNFLTRRGIMILMALAVALSMMKERLWSIEKVGSERVPTCHVEKKNRL